MVREWDAFESHVTCLSSFCNIVGAGSHDGNVSLFDIRCASAVASTHVSRSSITCIALGGSGSTANEFGVQCGTTSGNDYFYDFRFHNSKQVFITKQNALCTDSHNQDTFTSAMVSSVDGQSIALAQSNGSIKIREFSTGKGICEYFIDKSVIKSITFNQMRFVTEY